MLFSEHPPGLLQDRHLKKALVFILGTSETSACAIQSDTWGFNHRTSTKFTDDCTEIAQQKNTKKFVLNDLFLNIKTFLT